MTTQAKQEYNREVRVYNLSKSGLATELTVEQLWTQSIINIGLILIDPEK